MEMNKTKFERYQKLHYHSLLKKMSEAHEKLVENHVKGKISISDKGATGEPLTLEFWRNRANAFEDAYRHIYEYYRKSRLKMEKVGELLEKPKEKKQDTA